MVRNTHKELGAKTLIKKSIIIKIQTIKIEESVILVTLTQNQSETTLKNNSQQISSNILKIIATNLLITSIANRQRTQKTELITIIFKIIIIQAAITRTLLTTTRRKDL